MTRYIMNYNDYVEFFKEDTTVTEDEEEIIFLEIKAIDNAKDETLLHHHLLLPLHLPLYILKH